MCFVFTSCPCSFPALLIVICLTCVSTCVSFSHCVSLCLCQSVSCLGVDFLCCLRVSLCVFWIYILLDFWTFGHTVSFSAISSVMFVQMCVWVYNDNVYFHFIGMNFIDYIHVGFCRDACCEEVAAQTWMFFVWLQIPATSSQRNAEFWCRHVKSVAWRGKDHCDEGDEPALHLPQKCVWEHQDKDIRSVSCQGQ